MQINLCEFAERGLQGCAEDRLQATQRYYGTCAINASPEDNGY